MADQQQETNTIAQEELNPELPLQIMDDDANPFSYGEEAEDSSDGYEFEMDEEGDLQVHFSKNKEDSSEEDVEESSPETEEDLEQSLFSGVQDDQAAQALQQLYQQNQALQSRLEAIEKEKVQKTQELSKEEKLSEIKEKLINAGFMEEQIEALVEMGAFKEDASQSSENSGEEEDPEKVAQRKIQEAQVASRLINKYNGQGDAPHIQSMEPYVRYVEQRFGNALNDVDPETMFRISENVPFMVWLDKMYPDKMRSMNFRDTVRASENARQKWYAQYGISEKPSYFHLSSEAEELAKQMSQENGNTDEDDENELDDEVIQTLANQSKERSLGIPRGEFKGKETERKRPKTASEVASETFATLLG